jgi:oligopeptide transport system substrate-binding protein
VLVQPGKHLGLNTQITPTQDVNVRRAIASAIDRKALIDSVLEQPWHRPAQVVVPPSVEGYQGDDPSVGYGYDPQAAREYLAQAGFDEDNPPPPVELWYNREGNNEPLFRAVAEMLERVGIPVRLSSTSWNVHRDSLDACHASPRRVVRAPAECSYNAYRMGWVMDYADPSSILDVVFNPTSSFQYTGWESPTYEELMDQARSEPDEAGRTEQYREAERLLLNEAGGRPTAVLRSHVADQGQAGVRVPHDRHPPTAILEATGVTTQRIAIAERTPERRMRGAR